MKVFIIILFCILEYAGSLYLDGSLFFLYSVFCMLNAGIVYNLSKRDVLSHLVYIYVFTSWLIYNSLGFIHYTLVITIPQNIEQIYGLFILATILLYLPTLFVRKKSSSSKLLTGVLLNKKAVLVLIGLSMFFKVFKVVQAGGWHNYVYAAYGTKVESSLMTFFHLFEGIFGCVSVFLYPFIFKAHDKCFKLIAVSYILFTMFLGSVSGSSLSVLSPLLSIFVYAYFQTGDKWKKKIYKQCLYGSMLLGTLAGIIIRINRSDNSDFQIGNLRSAIDDIMLSPTFDNMVNFEWVLNNMEPTWSLGQILYPLVHFLPRAIFPWKPMELGAIVGLKFIGTSAEARVGFIPSALGDFYYDMGYIGIIGGLLFVGYVIAKMQNVLNASLTSNNPFVLPILITCSGSFMMLPAWYTGCFSGLVNFAIYLLVVKFVQKLFVRKLKYKY